MTVIAGVYVVVVQAVLAMVPEISPVLALMLTQAAGRSRYI